jgi:hypothetical protein
MHDLELTLQTLHDRDRRARTAPPDCVSLPRLRQLALDLGRSRPEEAAHLKTCARCISARQQIEAHLWHPPLRTLALRALGRPFDDASYVEAHLQRDGCARCRRLTGWTCLADVLGPVVDAVRVASRPILVPAIRQSWATDEAPGASTISLGDVHATVSDEDGLTVLELETDNADLADHTVRCVMLAEDATAAWTLDLTLSAPGYEGWSTARTGIAPTPEFRERAGESYLIVLLPEAPQ